MSKKDKPEEFALAKKTETNIALQGTVIDLPEGFIEDADFNYQQQEEAPIFPYIKIRQKDPKDENSTIEWKKGWWMASNTPTPVNDAEPPLIAIVLFWSKVRTYFEENAETPYCKSLDGLTGSLKTPETFNGTCVDKLGNPVCPFACWDVSGAKDNRPRCKEGRNLYAYSYIHGPCIIRLGTSALKTWRAFDNVMKTQKVKTASGAVVRIPYHLTVLEFHTQRVIRPGFDPYYIPDIRISEIVKDKDTLDVMRELLKSKEQYDRSAKQADIADDENDKVKDADYEIVHSNDPVKNADGTVSADDPLNKLF